MRLKLIFFYIISLVISKSYSQDKKLNIIGVDSTETSIINKIGYNIQHTDIISIEKEIKKVRTNLINDGYINTELISLDSISKNLFIAKLHLKSKIETIHIYTNNIFNEKFKKSLKEKISNDTLIIKYKNLEKTLENLTEKLSSDGYPFLSIKLSNISNINQNSLRADLKINIEGSKRKLNKIIVKGYESFPKSYLKHYLKLKQNTNFSITEIKKKTKALNNLSFSNQIKEPEILFSKDSTQLYLYVEKIKSNAFDGFIGFTTNEETNKIKFNGYLDIKLTNNLNYGESLLINYKSDESDQTNFNIEANLPYLFNSPIGLNTALKIVRVDSTFSNTTQKANITFQLNSENLFFGGIESSNSTNLSSNNTINNSLIDNYNATFTNFGYQYLKRQSNILFPIKTDITLIYGTGFRDNNNKTKQNKISIDANHIFSLNDRNSLYLRGKAEILSSSNYLENELYRFGGINSIRGFSENSIIASNYYLLNTEYRYNLSSNIYINSVVDIATFKNETINQNQNLYGFGFGFGILTKSGILSFVYANGKNEELPFKLNNSKIHLKLSAIF